MTPQARFVVLPFAVAFPKSDVAGTIRALGCVRRCKSQCMEAVPGHSHWTQLVHKKSLLPAAHLLLNAKCNKGVKMMVWILRIILSSSPFQAQVRALAQPRAAGSSLGSPGWTRANYGWSPSTTAVGPCSISIPPSRVCLGSPGKQLHALHVSFPFCSTDFLHILLSKLLHWQCSLSPYPGFPNRGATGASCDSHCGFQLLQTKLQTLCLKAHPKMMGDFNSSMTSGQPSAAARLTLMPLNCSDMSLITKPMPRNCSWNKSWPKGSFQRVFNPLFSNLWPSGCCTIPPGSLRGLQPLTASPGPGTATQNEEPYPKFRPLE